MTEQLLFKDLQSRRALKGKDWYSRPGVYAYFTGSDELRYVGRALCGSGGLSIRVCDHVKRKYRGDPAWDAVLDDPGSFAVVFGFEESEEVWMPSLELFLHQRFGDENLVNRRYS